MSDGKGQTEALRPKLGVTAREAAELLSISVRTVWREVKEGRLQVKRIGKRVVFPVTRLQEWLEQ